MRVRVLVGVLAIGMAVAGCSSSSKSGASSPTTSPAAARPKVTVIARDYSFQVPAQIPSGYVDVTVKNEGKEDHQAQLVKLGSMTLAQFKAAGDDMSKLKPGTEFVGGPNEAVPGASTTATLKLDPGNYAVVCFIPSSKDGKSHESKGMIKPVTVAKTADSVDVAPVADSTIQLSEFTFVVPKDFNGKGMTEVTNVGGQVHEMVMFKLKPGKTLDDAKKFLLVPPGTPPPAGPPPFSPIPKIGGLTGLTPNQSAWLDLDLAPGNYMLICFFPDPAKQGLPHALEGMVKEFTVS